MKKFHKFNPNRAKDNINKCTFILEALNQHLDARLYECFEKSKTMDELDKNVETLLKEYYICGNNIMDYYGVGDEEDDWPKELDE